MKKTIRILVPIILVLAILFSCAWYLFSYDQEFTRDLLVGVARFCQDREYHSAATWFYDLAYAQIGDNDAVAIELAQQYKNNGNYTKAEYTLRKAIADGASVELYVALSKTFVEQDKLLDAVNMLNNITDAEIKQQLDQMRPAAPSTSHAPGQYNQLITVEFTSPEGTLYVAADGEYPSTAADIYTDPIALVEGENNMYAVSVAENGLVSPLSVYGYTIGGIVRPVTFADSAVEAAVREILLINAPNVIHTNDLWKIKEFVVPAGAKNYSDIALMTYLEKLTVENAIGDQLYNISGLTELTELKITKSNVSADVLTSIAKLQKIKSLQLADCTLSSIAPLEGAASLEYLDLSSNAIRDLTPIGSLTCLKELILSHNAVGDLTALSNLNVLTKLDVSFNALTSLSGISNLTALTWLNADNNALIQIDTVTSLVSLNYLSLNSNKLKDISVVSNLEKLTELHIAGNELTNISSLSSLVKLTTLDFSNNKVTTIPTWPKNCALVNITGSSNKIKSLSPLSGLKNLNVVNMDYNKDISSVKDLADCPLLTQVNVYGTKVKNASDLTSKDIIVNYTPV